MNLSEYRKKSYRALYGAEEKAPEKEKPKMKQQDKEDLIDVIRGAGVIFGLCVFTIGIMTIAILGEPKAGAGFMAGGVIITAIAVN